jgi:hypothetical protein
LLAAYDTERRLQSQKLAPNFTIDSFVIEAGPAYFESAVKEVGEGLSTITTELGRRDTTPYSRTTK